MFFLFFIPIDVEQGQRASADSASNIAEIPSNNSSPSIGPFRIYYRLVPESDGENDDDEPIEAIRRKFVRFFANIFDEADRIAQTLYERFLQTFRDMITEMHLGKSAPTKLIRLYVLYVFL